MAKISHGKRYRPVFFFAATIMIIPVPTATISRKIDSRNTCKGNIFNSRSPSGGVSVFSKRSIIPFFSQSHFYRLNSSENFTDKSGKLLRPPPCFWYGILSSSLLQVNEAMTTARKGSRAQRVTKTDTFSITKMATTQKNRHSQHIIEKKGQIKTVQMHPPEIC